MPFTRDINERYSVTVRPASKIGVRQYEAEAIIYDRSKEIKVGYTSGAGATAFSAEQDAFSRAKAKTRELG
jgi:hypothetical protein